MKRFSIPILTTSIASLVGLLLLAFNQIQTKPAGAWQIQTGTVLQTLICTGNYFTISSYDIKNKKFFQSYGGTCVISNGHMSGTIEFHSENPSAVGQKFNYSITSGKDVLAMKRNEKEEAWMKIDNGAGALAGNWRITQREQNGSMNPMSQGPRKTIKVLSGTRFQWAAINIDSKEFFGTGGGTYTFKDGKYTERIEFFSRDSSRVGMWLSFYGKVDGNNWHHSGLSSRGDRISEIWSRK